MEVILLEKVANLGNLGDQVKVKPGYGRNFLIPHGKATPATAENIKVFEERRAELERQAAEALTAAQARAEKLEGYELTITAKAGEEGKLFGSIGTADIAQGLADAGFEVERQEVLLPEGAFRSVGEYEVQLRLHADVEASIKLVITAE